MQANSEIREPQKILSGFVARFPGAAVVHNDVAIVGVCRDELIELTVRYRRLVHVEVSITGYDDDPRSLYEVPEMRRWAQTIETRWPDWLFWLTPESLWVFVLSLNGDMHERQADGQLRVELDLERIAAQFAESQLAARNVLSDAGMADEDLERIEGESRENLIAMVQHQRFGDYNVLHPTDGTFTTYS